MAALVLMIVVAEPSWRFARHGITLAHEGGHALIAVLAGLRLAGIRLHSDATGQTMAWDRGGMGPVLTLLAGYPGPSLLGLAGVWLLASARIALLLWVCLLLLVGMLLMIRNLFGLLVVLVIGSATFAVSAYAQPAMQAAAAYGYVWFLLLGGVRGVAELAVKRWRGHTPDSDADRLAQITRLPAVLWVGLFALVAVAVVAIAVGLLLRPAVTGLSG